MSERSPYVPKDVLSLWMLADPRHPVLVGEISLALGGQGVALRYAEQWRARGFALSEDLPLVDELFVPSRKQEAVGAVDDARPDRWGERVIRKFERSPRMSLLEYLLFAGDDRYGALGVSQQPDTYEPWPASPMPTLGDLPAMQEVIRKIIANEPVGKIEERFLRPGVSLGGARPKSVVEIDGHPWLVKFAEGEPEDTPLIEHATMSLAARCGIEVAPTRALRVGDRHAIAVRRFDRAPGMRRHAISAHVVLRAVGEEYGYPQLAQQLRRMARPEDIARQQAQLFRRMVFNVFMDNTDDHEKNHALLREPDGSWSLSPAFDIVPSMSGLGYQAMAIGREGASSTLDNALSSARAFGLKPREARNIAHEIAVAVSGWHRAFKACGISPNDMDVLAQYLDNDRLGAQKSTAMGFQR
ncbi:type II toxin-antitoxin system HipA family toxin [Variovorax sp. YR216]|uniref:type II toxin-antitoxin system HipA family toxin n=1 Tax=Variovorax sp. YR216 TaxID=1882828 RepID=UPI00089856A3|nr:HipA domain-containing protein [Variovorax sp. YR216]SEB19906.1 serine/threonine-protein kinase HipA [Variovorax sp. YR216]